MFSTTINKKQTNIVDSVVRYVKLKKYQYDVTFTPYIMTPAEKIIFNSIVLTVLSLVFYAITVYLPKTIQKAFGSAWLYHAGDEYIFGFPGSTYNQTMSIPVDQRFI